MTHKGSLNEAVMLCKSALHVAAQARQQELSGKRLLITCQEWPSLHALTFKWACSQLRCLAVTVCMHLMGCWTLSVPVSNATGVCCHIYWSNSKLKQLDK